PERGAARFILCYALGEPRQLGVERRHFGDRRGERRRGIALRRFFLRPRRDERAALLLEPRQRGAGIGGELFLSLDVGGELGHALARRFARRRDAPLFLFERLARQQQALQLGGGGGLGLAERRQLARRLFARAVGGERRRGVVGNRALGRGQSLEIGRASCRERV